MAPVLAVPLVRDRLENANRRSASPPSARKRVVVGEERIARARRARALEGGEARSQSRALERPHRLIIDRVAAPRAEAIGRQRGERFSDAASLGQVARGEHVDQQRIQKTPVGGMIGARALAVAREQRVHRADAEEGRAGAPAAAPARPSVVKSPMP